MQTLSLRSIVRRWTGRQRAPAFGIAMLLAGSIALFGWTSTASASQITVETLGDPEPGNSWEQGFRIGSLVGAHAIAMRITGTDTNGNPATFAPTATVLDAYTSDTGSWSFQELFSPYDANHHVLFGDPEDSHVDFLVSFEGDKVDWSTGNPLTIEFAAYGENNEWIGSTGMQFFGPLFGWSPAVTTWNPGFDGMQLMVIPLPAPVWMGLAGLAGVIVLRRRLRV